MKIDSKIIKQLQNHIGFAGLVIAIIPLIICFKSFTVSMGGSKHWTLVISLPIIAFICWVTLNRWQGKVLFGLLTYFLYRLFTDPICVVF